MSNHRNGASITPYENPMLRRSQTQRQKASPLMEQLEPRRLLTDIRWVGADGGLGGNNVSWSDPFNWQGSVAPTTTDVAIFQVAAAVSVDVPGITCDTIKVDSGANEVVLDLNGHDLTVVNGGLWMSTSRNMESHFTLVNSSGNYNELLVPKVIANTPGSKGASSHLTVVGASAGLHTSLLMQLALQRYVPLLPARRRESLAALFLA